MSYNINGEITSQRSIGLYAFPSDYVVIDIETTGLSPSYCEIIELSAVKIKDNSIVDTFSSLVKPKAPIPEFIEKLTGITNSMVESAPTLEGVLPNYLKFLDTNIVVGHNISFDIHFLSNAMQDLYNEEFHNDHIDTLRISRKLIKSIANYKLSTIAEYFNIVPENQHRALDDCNTTNEIFKKLSSLNKETESAFIRLFDNVPNILEGKTVVFKGLTTLCSYDSYCTICEKAGGRASTIFFSDKTDYIVFGQNTYLKFIRGDFSEKMIKAIDLSNQGKLKILSEEGFMQLLGITIPNQKKPSYSKKIDTKSMVAETDDFDETHPLFGKVCVFTGVLDKMPRKQAMQIVLNLGGKIGNSVTQETNYLILGCNDYCKSIKDGKSSKHKKAEDLKLKGFDIEVIPEDVFYDMIDE